MPKASLACIFLASGFSKRFGSNKLLAHFNESTIGEHVLQSHAAELFLQTVVVTRYPTIALCAAQRGFTVCENTNLENNIAETIKLGVCALKPELDGCMFSTCDMPYFTAVSCKALVEKFTQNKDSIIAAADNGVRKNPVIFPSKYFKALKELPFNTGGSFILKQNQKNIITVDISSNELFDIDTKEDMSIYIK